MEILINTDNNIDGTAQMIAYFKEETKISFERFSDHLTRIEIKISDENGDKSGEKDKRCVLEARIKGMQPIAVTGFGNTVEKAFHAAVDKMKTSLDSTMGKLKTY
ncbi:HPF/RaiA family ribosome-associated protein [Halpernia sp.]|uniref:HPF/RaiA family ribosome-associated protein n=1 Tax=Halpernia sp. TaxID=2782209 RepID=UPI003A8DFE28